jgi:hypothetical protein
VTHASPEGKGREGGNVAGWLGDGDGVKEEEREWMPIGRRADDKKGGNGVRAENESKRSFSSLTYHDMI